MIGDLSTEQPTAVFFSVEQDENGYPSVGCEQVWCLPVERDRFVVEDIPFYARDVSMGDEISTELRDVERWFSAVVRPSRNTTIRAFARKPEIEKTLRPKLESFRGLTKKMEGSPLIAVSLPPSADIAGAMDYLDRESNAGNVAFEESCVRQR
jgi:hypothetical protein